MTRRFMTGAVAAGLMLAAGAVALANRPVTYILTNGERLSGELTYKGGREFTLIVNGRPIDFQPEQIAAFAFVPGDPPTSELQQLPTNGDSSSLERDMIVTRSGNIIRMKLYSISDDGEMITYDTVENGEPARFRKIPSSEVARMYILGANARHAFSSRLGSASQAVATTGQAGAGTIQVPANQRWTDTGLTVQRGERIAFYPSGEIKIGAADDPNFVTNAGGSVKMTIPRTNLPVRTMPWGALVGRVGAGNAFSVGKGGNAITMPAAGRLYLGINDDEFSDNTGAFTVTVVR